MPHSEGGAHANFNEFSVSAAVVDRAIRRLGSLNAEHFAPLLSALGRGTRLLVIQPGKGRFRLSRNSGPTILCFAGGACSPTAFDRRSLDRALKNALGICVLTSPSIEAVAAAAALAMMGGRYVVIVETTERYEADWIKALRERAPKVPVLLATSAEGSA